MLIALLMLVLGLGLAALFVLGGVFSWDWFWQMKIPRLLERPLGRRVARVAAIAIGAAIAGISLATWMRERRGA